MYFYLRHQKRMLSKKMTMQKTDMAFQEWCSPMRNQVGQESLITYRHSNPCGYSFWVSNLWGLNSRIKPLGIQPFESSPGNQPWGFNPWGI